MIRHGTYPAPLQNEAAQHPDLPSRASCGSNRRLETLDFVTAAEVFEKFGRAWNVADDDQRLQLLAASCIPDAVFVSPQGQSAGIVALSASISEFRRMFPAAMVSFGHPNEHGGFARVAWATHWNNSQPTLTGEDFAQLASDGRVELLVSFDGAPPACR